MDKAGATVHLNIALINVGPIKCIQKNGLHWGNVVQMLPAINLLSERPCSIRMLEIAKLKMQMDR